MSEKQSIVFIGLGAMGIRMARHLLSRPDVSLIVWNRSTDKCNEFVAAGAQQASSPAQALSLGGPNAIIMSCLFDDAGLFQTFDAEFLSALLPGQVHVCCATVAPATARTFASLHQERGAIWVSAPVFGRPPAVEAKLLHVVVSGADVALLQRLTPFLLAFSQKVHDFGCRDVAAANIVKLCGNFMICGSMQIMSEAYTLAQKNNINPMDIHTMLTSSLFAAPLFQSYGGQIAAGQYTDVKVPFSLGHKDIGLVNDIAVESGTPMPVAELLHQEFQEGISRGWGASVEWSALGLLQAERAGLSIDAMLPEHLRGSQAKGNQQ